jgi:hypothetical protein
MNFDKNKRMKYTKNILASIYRISKYISFDFWINYAYTSINFNRYFSFIKSTFNFKVKLIHISDLDRISNECDCKQSENVKLDFFCCYIYVNAWYWKIWPCVFGQCFWLTINWLMNDNVHGILEHINRCHGVSP